MKNCIKTSLCLFGTFRRFIWLLRKYQFLGHCASIVLLLRFSQLFMNCKSTNYFTTGNRLHNWLLCIEKMYDNFKSPIWKYFKHLNSYCAKPNFLATAHHTIIFLLRISQFFCLQQIEKIFHQWKSSIYLLTVHRKILLQPQIAYLERFNDLYGYSAQPIFPLIHICHLATAHLPIIYLVQIEQLFRYCESPKYLITVQRKILWQHQIAYLEIFRRFICLLRKSPILYNCASYKHFATAHLPNIC